jgi:hypothetical protein
MSGGTKGALASVAGLLKTYSIFLAWFVTVYSKMASCGQFLPRGASAGSWARACTAAVSLLPSAAVVAARPLARQPVLVLTSAAAGAACGAAVLGTGNASGMQDPCEFLRTPSPLRTFSFRTSNALADTRVASSVRAVMWGRHDKRTKKGKRHIGKHRCLAPPYNAGPRARASGNCVVLTVSPRRRCRYVRKDQAAQARPDAVLTRVLGWEAEVGSPGRWDELSTES